MDQRDAAVADIMSSMVAQFAKTGNPNLDQATLKKLGKTWTWPKLDAQEQYLDIGLVLVRKFKSRPRKLLTSITTGIKLYAELDRAGPAAVGLLIIGCVIYFVGTAFPLFYRLLGALIAVAGLAKLLQILLGAHRSRFIRFEPRALCISERSYCCKVAWDDIRAFELLGQALEPSAVLRFAAHERIEVRPTWRRAHLERDLVHERAGMRSHLIVRPHMYGIDADAFITAVAHHVSLAREHQTR